MNNYQSNPNAWRAEMGKSGSVADLWSSFTQFASRQPELVIGGALLGGALLAFLVKGSAKSDVHYYGQHNSARPAQYGRQPYRPEGYGRAEASRAESRAQRMPSARLGATEEQMSDNFETPSSHALEAGSGGTTGAIYDLDPGSLTSG